MEWFLGIDGGQSSTTVLIGDEDGRVIGSSRGGPCNHVSSAEAAGKFRRVISECVAQACRSAGIDPDRAAFASACCGMSGGPEDKKAILAELIPTARLLVTTDGTIALAGALAGREGVAVISGTGSIAYGKKANERPMRAGGWGYVFGDEGSAFDISRQAVRASLRLEEGWGAPTELLRALLDITKARNADQMLHLLYTPEWPRSRVATLSMMVDSVCMRGDAVARGILEQAAQSLASLGASIRVQLFAAGEIVDVAYIGGVFRSTTLLERFRMLVEEDGCRCRSPLLNPAAGALLEAYAAAHRVVTLVGVPDFK